MAFRKGGSPTMGGAPLEKPGPLTRATYSDAVVAYTKAKGTMPTLDSREPEDIPCFDAWVEYLTRVLGAKSFRVKALTNARFGVGGETRWSVPERFPWLMTGEAPFTPRKPASTDAKAEPDPVRRKAMAAYVRSVMRNGYTADGDTAEEVSLGEQIYLGVKARRRSMMGG